MKRTPEEEAARKVRQAKDRAALKCWCGNVAGLGQRYCRAHRADPMATIKRAEIMRMLDTLEEHSPTWIQEIRNYILKLEKNK